MDNLVVIVDWNGIQGSDFCEDVLPLTGLKIYKVANEFGWSSREVSGHDLLELEDALAARRMAPIMVVADTVKGKWVSFMENSPRWHSNWLSPDLEKQALEELP